MKDIKGRWLMGVMLVLLAACTKMDDSYKQFLDGGEIIYTGKVDSLKVFPGKNRVLLSWYLVSDPKITKCRVYWNQRGDSAEVAVKRTGGTDTIRLFLDKLPENIYTFQVYTYDNAGHSSVKEEVIGNAYGDAYIATLSNRPVRSAKYDAVKKETTIWWFGVNNQVQSVEISYTNNAGAETKMVQVADSVPANPRDPLEFRASVKLPDYKAGTSLKYRTSYKPVKVAIDTFYTAYETQAVQ
ncbi:DUF4998 domain-containing protein [Chitinophaga qingshengii]|uniref:DUF4998 domain-containing protein n=1 Tax=Chitinophaga qingshengii TaxID=1569794 RepID=A0ABR7TSR5_9BACT|nr:DUF4998 domain-containing protein [Chitinophaga qingshengii]MBC9932638.1 DUF4998 domain-containing protein [Chitinophaga qingshengii]